MIVAQMKLTLVRLNFKLYIMIVALIKPTMVRLNVRL